LLDSIIDNITIATTTRWQLVTGDMANECGYNNSDDDNACE
jgi:hypothetical protein